MILAICHWWIVGLWVVFVVYWAIAALAARSGPSPKRSALRRPMAMRLLIISVVILAIELARRASALHRLQVAELRSIPLAVSGAVIATLGAALAFTARAAIGRNWGPPATRRTDTELIMRGPYAFVRHPIYSGILLMMIGTAIGLLPTWWLVAAAAGTYFFISARAEEQHMGERFPDAYPGYRSRTWMLVPFLF